MTKPSSPPSSPVPSDERIRCVQCDSVFTNAQVDEAFAAGKRGCPACGTDALPVKVSNDVQVKINTHELRVLTIWASNYADAVNLGPSSRKTLECILQRLREQLPNVALTMTEEVRDLQNLGHNAELVKEDGTVIVPRKGPPS